MNKKLLFITGSRADFGKLKSLIRNVQDSPLFECAVFVTGMHTLSKYGYTVDEVYKSIDETRLSEGFRSVFILMNQIYGEPMDFVLANTIIGLSRYVHEFQPDLIVVHGDRVETLAGAIVGALNNILVAHIEGGEISGTIDETIRHAVSKISHLHFVSNKQAANRLIQMGENPKSIFIIGSPEVDLMLSTNLPQITDVKNHYGIQFDKYAIVIFHPVTTDLENTSQCAKNLVSALLASKDNYIVIYPNNDVGSDLIFASYEKLKSNSRFKMFPSLRFEYFLTLLKHSLFLIGNSSAGIRESPIYGIYSININNRQKNRYMCKSIINVEGTSESIEQAIESISKMPKCEPNFNFGSGNSAKLFLSIIQSEGMWNISKQKQFIDIKPIIIEGEQNESNPGHQ
jgi:UDP-N-acetylglucosamine 2-epimerase (hydrolysing)